MRSAGFGIVVTVAHNVNGGFGKMFGFETIKDANQHLLNFWNLLHLCRLISFQVIFNIGAMKPI